MKYNVVNSTPAPWRGPFQEAYRCLNSHLGRIQTEQLAEAYLQGLLSPVERENKWQLAEYPGQVNPYRLQYLLDRAVWDADAVRDTGPSELPYYHVIAPKDTLLLRLAAAGMRWTVECCFESAKGKWVWDEMRVTA